MKITKLDKIPFKNLYISVDPTTKRSFENYKNTYNAKFFDKFLNTMHRNSLIGDYDVFLSMDYDKQLGSGQILARKVDSENDTTYILNLEEEYHPNSFHMNLFDQFNKILKIK